MLQKDLLEKLSSYVMESIASQEDLMSQEFISFTRGCYEETKVVDKEASGLFTEWLVFDKKQKMFGNKSGLEYFLATCGNIEEKDMKKYKDLLLYEVGLFEVIGLTKGVSLLLKSLATSKEYEVFDKSASEGLKKGAIIWVRIAQVESVYYMVGSTIFSADVSLGRGLRNMLTQEKRNSFDAMSAFRMFLSKEDLSDDEDVYEETGIFPSYYQGVPSPYDELGVTQVQKSKEYQEKEYIRLKEDFGEVLKEANMDSIIPLSVFETWVTDKRRYKAGFAVRAVFFLAPNETEDNIDLRKNLLSKAGAFSNSITMLHLQNKKKLKNNKDTKNRFEMDTYSHEPYIVHIKKGLEYTKEKEFEKAYKEYEACIRLLLKDKILYFDCFRVFCNAGGVKTVSDEWSLFGEELMHASLRINDQYSFATQSLEKYGLNIERNFDDKKLSKKEKEGKEWYLALKKSGEQEYNHSVFKKYEDFLKSSGVSLSYKPYIKPMVFSTNKQDSHTSIGRKDPCPCGSGKKMKRCSCGEYKDMRS